MKRTALYEDHVKLGAKLVEFAGFEMPISYTSIKEEHNYVRTKAGLFDVSHMGEFRITGDNATSFVDTLFTNDVYSMNNNDILYGMMCYPSGGVVDDLLVYKYSEFDYMLVVNASNIDKDLNWVLRNNTFDCSVENRSEEISEIALQGPKAETILQQLTAYNLDDLTFFTFNEFTISDHSVLVSRTGYTGEDGFEIYGSHTDIVALWRILLDTGSKDIAPCGLGARDTLRFEVALPLYGNELTKSITPLEAGLSFAVKFTDHDFIGKKALRKQKKEKTKRRIVGLELLDKGIIRHGYSVYFDDTLVGEVTTGYKSPSTGRVIALAMIDRPYDKLGTTLQVEVRNKRKDCKVVKRKFYEKQYKN